jgi:hypothetical protein
MLFGPPARRPQPEMGFSITGMLTDVVKAPLNLAVGLTGAAIGAQVDVAKQVVGAFGTVGRSAGAAVGSTLAATSSGLGPALQALRPPAAAIVPPPASMLPIYLGVGAAGLVLVLLLTAPPKRSAPMQQAIGP